MSNPDYYVDWSDHKDSQGNRMLTVVGSYFPVPVAVGIARRILAITGTDIRPEPIPEPDMRAYHPTWTALGDNHYRIISSHLVEPTGGFVSEVRMWRDKDNRQRCTVISCNNVMINARDIEAWAEREIG